MNAFEIYLLTAVCIAAMWPAIVLLALLIFRSQITSLIPRIKKADFGSVGVEWYEHDRVGGPVPKDAKEIEGEPEAEEKITWDKPATLFWLGNDLMWTQDMIYREAPAGKILEGLKNSLAYVRRLGPSAKGIEDQLIILLPQIEAYVGMDPAQYFRPHFREAAKQIGTVIIPCVFLETNLDGRCFCGQPLPGLSTLRECGLGLRHRFYRWLRDRRDHLGSRIGMDCKATG